MTSTPVRLARLPRGLVWRVQRWLILRDFDPVYVWLSRTFPTLTLITRLARGRR